MEWRSDPLCLLWWCERRNNFIVSERPEIMEQNSMLCLSILKLVMPIMQWQRRNHHIQCQMIVSLIFDLSLSLLQEENYIRVILPHPNNFCEFEHHLNEALWFLHSANPPSKSKINICSTMLFWHEIKHI